MNIDLPPLEGALCAEVDSDIFFPEKGGTHKDAKAICRRCDVQAACLEYALANGEHFGIWGNHSERERRRIARDRALTTQPGSTGSTHRKVMIRRDKVRAMRDQGLGRAAIAERLGTSRDLISQDLAVLAQQDLDLPDIA